MNIWNVNQQQEDWFRVRMGRPTASQFSRIVTTTGKASSQWEDYAIALAAESIESARPPGMNEWQGNRHTDRGNEFEPIAREEFARRTGLEVREVGFVTDDGGVAGCSPDGLVYAGGKLIGGLEIKCPDREKAARILVKGVLPDEYKVQIHGSMAVTGLDRWWFCSFHEDLPPLILCVERSDFTLRVRTLLDDFLIYYAEQRKTLIPILTGAGEDLPAFADGTLKPECLI